MSRDIDIISTISEDLRIKSMNGIRKIFNDIKGRGDIRQRASDIKRQVESIVDELLANKSMMVNMIDLKCFDNYTYLHSVNVAVLSIVTGIAIGLSRETLSRLGVGAILHDIGKVFVSKSIVSKPSVLTQEEFEQIKKHSQLGCEYAKEN